MRDIQPVIDGDLAAFLGRPDFKPVKYRHLKTGNEYTVVSVGEYRLSKFSKEGEIHNMRLFGRMVECELQASCTVENDSLYAGRIVIYTAQGKFWMRPHFEFFDGRFEKVESQ